MLVVDLDHTLIKSDLMLEAFFEGLARDPGGVLRALLRRGGKQRVSFKTALTRAGRVPPEDLPYNEEVVAYVRRRRAEGERTALVSGSDQRMVELVAEHVGLFDEVWGSTDGRDLSGANKAAFLTERYGEGGFDYVADSQIDAPTWKAARNAVTVGAGPRVRKLAEAARGGAVEHLGGPQSWVDWFAAVLSAIRPHQWMKNILVFLPALAAQQTLLEVWRDGLVAFIAFSLTASSVYLLNDLLDLTADRAHPRKRHRALASGRLRVLHGAMLAPGLVTVAVGLSAWMLPQSFLLALAFYYSATLAYSFSLKRKLVIDICTLAGLYSLRVLAGGEAMRLYISPWTLAFTSFLFLSLAAIKRQAELVDGLRRGKDRASGRAYEVDDLPIVAMMAIAAGYVSVLVLALYASSAEVKALYRSPTMLWASCPVLLYWISRMAMLAHRGRMTDDPLVFAMRDPISLFSASAILAIGSAGNWL